MPVHVGDLDRVVGFWLGHGRVSSPALAVGGIWEVNQQIEDPFLFVSVSLAFK